MKISELWLREWIDTSYSIKELAEYLTDAGLEIDSIAPFCPLDTQQLRDFIVGKITDIHQIETATKELLKCQVDIGDQKLDIICSDLSLAVGSKVVVAKPGATLFSGERVVVQSLYDFESMGLLCSGQDLGLTETATEVIKLPEQAVIGEVVTTYLGLQEQILELEITPNRGDCLSMLGVSRELAALKECPFNIPELVISEPQTDSQLKITVADFNACPNYVGRVIEGISWQNKTTPLWLQRRLWLSGVRSIDPIVDVTNYVMLELGQPLHAFSLGSFTNKHVQVRWSTPGEQITLLNAQEIRLNKETLLITNDQQPVAIAGVMGGLDSAVQVGETSIWLESAFFRPDIISRQAQAYGLSSESSFRFERGVDPQQQKRGLERATELILEILGGKPGPIVSSSSIIPEKNDSNLAEAQIYLSQQKIAKILGCEFDDSTVTAILRRLGMDLVSKDGGWLVDVPSYRFDLKLDVDLIEEIARVYGYRNLPQRFPVTCSNSINEPEAKVSLSRIRRLLVDRSFQEVISYSFVHPDWQSWFDPGQDPVRLRNPISEEMSVMRTSLWPGLTKVAQYNLQRQQTRIRIFEIGRKFLWKAGQDLQQPLTLAALIAGPVLPMSWTNGNSRSVDFFDLKGDLEILLEFSHQAANFKRASHPVLHPGQSAQVLLRGEPIGWIGTMHPEAQRRVGLKECAVMFEILLAPLLEGRLPKVELVSKFPTVQRDLAFLVSDETPVADVLDAIKEVATDLLRDVFLFDVYQGEGIGLGHKSLAFNLTFQHPSHTLIESEINSAIDAVILNLKKQFNAILRD